jgi:LytR cell envelope-related transcriptional attenuator
MTGTASDRAAPALTRAERRRKRSWFQRRRARRSARRRDAGPRRTEVSGDVGAPDAPDAVTTAPAAPTPMVWPPVPEPEPVPVPMPVVVAPEPEPEPTAASAPDVAETTTARRDRRGSKRARRARARRTATMSAPAVVVPPAPPATVVPPPVTPVAPAPAPAPAKATPAVPAGTRSAGRARARRTARPTAKTRPARDAGDRRFWTRVMPVIAGLLVVAVVVGAIVRRNDDTGTPRAAASGPSAPVEERPVLLVHVGASGNDLLAVADRDGRQGSVLMVPVATQLDVPSQGTSVLQDIPALDGAKLLTNSVENEIGVAIGRTVLLDDAGLTAALGPAAPFSITLTEPVGFSDRSAKYRAGGQEVSAAQASELMSAPESVNELDRLVVVAAVMDGWMDRLRDPAIAKATLQLQPGLAPLVAAAGAAERRLDTVPVASIATGGGERFDIRGAELATIVRRAFPHAQLGEHGQRPRVEILNGTGALGVAQATATKVVPAGGRIVNSDNLHGFGLQKTQVVYYNDRWRGAAQRILDAMGCGSLRKAGQDVRIADVTILVGSDCPAYGAPGG